jgi:hypothetical protein
LPKGRSAGESKGKADHPAPASGAELTVGAQIASRSAKRLPRPGSINKVVDCGLSVIVSACVPLPVPKSCPTRPGGGKIELWR